MPELAPSERRALLVTSALVVLGAAVRVGLGPGEAAYSWRPVEGDGEAARLDSTRVAVRAAVRREERADLPLAPGETVDPNAAPVEELRRLPGVGPATARAIVATRRERPFVTREDLLRVRGIGPARLRALSSHLTLPTRSALRAARGTGARDRSGRVDLNRAEVGDLEELPHVGPVLARRILELRREKGGFEAVEELLAVRGIGEVRLAQLRERVYVR